MVAAAPPPPLAMLHALIEPCRAAWHDLELLLNAIGVGLAGFLHRWRDRDRRGHRGFRNARDATYHDLCVMLEGIYWTLRDHDSDHTMLRPMLHEVNSFLMENFLHLQPGDQLLVGRYLLAIHRLNALSRCVAATESTRVWEGRERLAPHQVVNVDAAIQEVIALRNRVLVNMRRMSYPG